MKRLSILTFLALFAATLTQQGAARAQNQDTKDENWGQVPTVSTKWTHITEGSSSGFELRDDYYYVSKDLTFSAYRDFSSSEMLTDVQDDLCDQISKDLTDLIFNATIGDW